MKLFKDNSITIRIRQDSDGYFRFERRIFWFLWEAVYTDAQGQPKRFINLSEAAYYKNQFIYDGVYNTFAKAEYTYKKG